MSDFKKGCDAIRKFALTDMDLVNIRDLLKYNMERGLQKETYQIATGTPKFNLENLSNFFMLLTEDVHVNALQYNLY